LTAPLPFTGERFTPEVSGAIWYEHWHRYCAVLSAAKGKRVLDAACGEGYGSGLLSSVAAEVVGVDIDPEAIGHARDRYRDQSNLRFVQGSCTALPLSAASVDLVVSFETIEHLVEQEQMLDEIRRVLAPDGILVISSPNKAIYSEASGHSNHFHVRELARDELVSLLSPRFPRQAWYGQRVLAQSMLWSEERAGERVAELVALNANHVEMLDAPAPAMYFVVVCGGDYARLPSLASLSIFDDGSQSLYRDYDRALLAEKRLYWDEIDARKIAEQRLQQAIDATNALASSRQREDALSARIPDLETQLAHHASEVARVDAELVRTQIAYRQAAAALADAEARLAYRESAAGWMRWPLSRVRRMVGGGAS
jgi:SAM-dependent methyltransferase